jgi:hypothetical protein
LVGAALAVDVVAHDAGDRDVDPLSLQLVDGGDQCHRALVGVAIGHRHDDQNLGRGAERVDGQQSEVRRAIDQHQVVAVDVSDERVCQVALAHHLTGEREPAASPPAPAVLPSDGGDANETARRAFGRED